MEFSPGPGGMQQEEEEKKKREEEERLKEEAEAEAKRKEEEEAAAAFDSDWDTTEEDAEAVQVLDQMKGEPADEQPECVFCNFQLPPHLGEKDHPIRPHPTNFILEKFPHPHGGDGRVRGGDPFDDTSSEDDNVDYDCGVGAVMLIEYQNVHKHPNANKCEYWVISDCIQDALEKCLKQGKTVAIYEEARRLPSANIYKGVPPRRATQTLLPSRDGGKTGPYKPDIARLYEDVDRNDQQRLAPSRAPVDWSMYEDEPAARSSDDDDDDDDDDDAGGGGSKYEAPPRVDVALEDPGLAEQKQVEKARTEAAKSNPRPKPERPHPDAGGVRSMSERHVF